jgi:DNA-directed RNA polymerase subunit RPC12/RpoP
MIPGRQRGVHTWDLKWDYLRCPQCGYITEDRHNYTYEKGLYTKDAVCQKCKHSFKKEIKPNSLGSFF